MCSRLPPPPQIQIQIRGWEKNDTFFIDRKEEKKKGRKEGGKKEGRERKEKGGEERREIKKGGIKECKCVFRHFQFHVVDHPPPPKVQIWIRGWGKNDTFFINRKEEKKKGRKKQGSRERMEEGGEERRKERKKGGKKRNVNVFKALPISCSRFPPSPPKYKFRSGAGKK